MGNERVYLGRFHSDEVMVIFFIAECACETHSKLKSTRERNCYNWLKKYCGRGCGPQKWRLCPPKGPKWWAQPGTQPQIAVFASEVVISKVTLNDFIGFFGETILFVSVVERLCLPTLRCSLTNHHAQFVASWELSS